jgi:CHASE2 domain-containing sensor protein
MKHEARGDPSVPKLSLFVCVVCLLAASALLYAPLRAEFLKIEPWTADWRTMLLSDKRTGPHPTVALVVINKETLAGYPYHSPTPRNLLISVLKAVEAAGPAATGLDTYFVRPTEPDNDQAFIRGVREMRAVPGRENKIVLAAVNESALQFSESERQFQRRFLSEAGPPVGFLNLRRDPDDVVRRTSPPVAGSEFPDSLALQVARATLGPATEVKVQPPSTRIAWLLRETYSPEAFVVVLAHDLLPGAGEAKVAAARAQLKGKAVLIGSDRPYVDHHRTPFSIRSGDEMLGLMVHGHITAQYLDGRSFTELGAMAVRILVGALALLGLLLGWIFWEQRLDLTGRSIATVALVMTDGLVYSQLRIILPFTLALTAWLIGVTSGHHLRSLVTWASSTPASTHAMRFNRT